MKDNFNKRHKNGLSVLKTMQKNKDLHKYKFKVGDYVEPNLSNGNVPKDILGIIYKVTKLTWKGYIFQCISKESFNKEYQATAYINVVNKAYFELHYKKVNFELYKALYKDLEFCEETLSEYDFTKKTLKL